MSKEYIERERYYKYSMLYDLAYHDDVNGNCDGKIDITVVDCISGADVKPVQHGEWLKQEQEYPMMGCKVIVGYKCSVCGGKQELKTNYCCDCGATMDGGNK